jgi:hypothetical protein
MLTNDQVYDLVRKTVSEIGSLSPAVSRKDFEQMSIKDLRFDSTDTSDKIGAKNFFQKLQFHFDEKDCILDLTEDDIFSNPAVSTMKDIVVLCALSQVEK